MVNIKEQTMNLMKATTAALLSAVILSACQGQNPFKRESNPVRNYPNVDRSIENKESTVPYGVNPKTAMGTPYDCTGSLTITSNSPDGQNVFYFVEDSAASFQVNVLNRLGDKFELTTSALPDGAEFKLLKQLSDNSAIYQLSWTPKAAGRATINLQMRSEALSARCKGAIGMERLHLLAEKTKGKPTVSVSGLQKTIEYGQEDSFTVEVTDPQAKDLLPSLNPLVFDASIAKDSELPVIDGSKAADCTATPKLNDEGRYQFDCKFLSTALTEGEVASLRGSGKSALAVFSVSAQSRGLSTNVLPVQVKVAFKKVAAAKGQKK